MRPSDGSARHMPTVAGDLMLSLPSRLVAKRWKRPMMGPVLPPQPAYASRRGDPTWVARPDCSERLRLSRTAQATYCARALESWAT